MKGKETATMNSHENGTYCDYTTSIRNTVWRKKVSNMDIPKFKRR
jgi:hypothetical protein